LALQIFNTLTRRKEEFIPRTRNFVRIYTCGLTVYDYMHIGHARTYIFWDVFRRYLYFRGYEMISVLNYTDIEDRIITRANERGIDFRELTDEFIEAFDEDCDALGIIPYTVQCRATDYIPEMIEMVRALVEKGYAYEIDGDVYFDVHKFPGYGSLSGHNVEDLEAGARVEVDERKRHPADFALWKAAKPGEPTWDSPWGPGRPGWHIECSVMSSHFLGPRMDIHGGAVDNMFPHHENEIAQSEAYFDLAGTKERWCNYFMHPEHLLVDDVKMSKSLGNFITARALLAEHDARVIRLAFTLNHYRTQMSISTEGLTSAASALSRIDNFVRIGYGRLKALEESKTEADENAPLAELAAGLHDKFVQAMDDDLNCPAALGAIFDFIKSANQRGWESCDNPADIFLSLAVIDELLGVLGIGSAADSGDKAVGGEIVGGLMNLVLEIRKKARASRDFATSDAIRDGLSALGITIEDTADGARWRYSPESS